MGPSWPPSPKPRLMPKLPPPTMVDTTAVDTDMVTDTVLDTADTMVDTTAMDFTVADTDTDTTSARGLLMPNPKLMPKLESHFTAMLTVSILMVSVPTVPILMLMADTTVTVSSLEPQATNTFLPLPPPTVSLKSTNDLLMLNPKQRLMPKLPPLTTVDTTAVDTDTVTDTTVLDTVDTMVDT